MCLEGSILDGAVPVASRQGACRRHAGALPWHQWGRCCWVVAGPPDAVQWVPHVAGCRGPLGWLQAAFLPSLLGLQQAKGGTGWGDEPRSAGWANAVPVLLHEWLKIASMCVHVCGCTGKRGSSRGWAMGQFGHCLGWLLWHGQQQQ